MYSVGEKKKDQTSLLKGRVHMREGEGGKNPSENCIRVKSDNFD